MGYGVGHLAGFWPIAPIQIVTHISSAASGMTHLISTTIIEPQDISYRSLAPCGNVQAAAAIVVNRLALVTLVVSCCSDATR